MVKVTLDIVLDGETPSEIDAALARYVSEDLPQGITAAVEEYFGPGGGNPCITLTAPDEKTMRDALWVYTNHESEEVDFFMGKVDAA